MLIDTHCHLAADAFAADREEVVAAARAVGVSKFVVPAVDVASFADVRCCCARYAGSFPAYGIHPLLVRQSDEADLTFLRAWLAKAPLHDPQPIAVGEIGLDLYVADPDIARQEHFFVEQLRIAREADLPVLLHVRRSVDRVLKYLRRIPVKGGIAHAFNGSEQQAATFIALGFKLGFGGAMTHPQATRIRRLATSLPLAAIVLETDAPDMPPAWAGDGRNMPSALAAINLMLSELRGIDADELAAATSENACAILPQLRSVG